MVVSLNLLLTNQQSFIEIKDHLLVIWHKPLVDPFINSPLTAPPPNFLSNHFDSNAQTFAEFSNRHSKAQPEALMSEFMPVLLSGLSDSKVGSYSVLHESSMFVNGYDHLETIRLAYMCVLYALSVHLLC